MQKPNPFGTCGKGKEFLNSGISKCQALRIEYFSIFNFYCKTCASKVRICRTFSILKIKKILDK
jgi:hypothetical protein